MNEQSDQVSINKNNDPVTITPEPFNHVNKDPVTIKNEDKESDPVMITPEPFDHVNKDPALPVNKDPALPESDPELFDHVNKDPVTIMNEQSDKVSINKDPALPDQATITNEYQEYPEPFDHVLPDSSEPIDNSESPDPDREPSDNVIPMSEDSSEGHCKEYDEDDDDYGPYPEPSDDYDEDDDDYGPYPEPSDDYGIPQPLTSKEKDIWTVQQLYAIMDQVSETDIIRILAYKTASLIYDGDTVEYLKGLCVENKIKFEVVKCAGDDDYGIPQPLTSEEKEIWTVQQLQSIMDEVSDTDIIRILAYKTASVSYVGDTVDQLKGLCDENMIKFEVVKYAGQPSTASPIPPAVVVFGPGGIGSSSSLAASSGMKLSKEPELEPEPSDHVIASDGTPPPLSSEEKEVWSELQIDLIMDRLSDKDIVRILAYEVGDKLGVDRLRDLCVQNMIKFEVVGCAGQPSTAPVSISKPASNVIAKSDSSEPSTAPVSIRDQSDNVIAKSDSSEPSTATPRTPALGVFGAGATCPPSSPAASPSGGSGCAS